MLKWQGEGLHTRGLEMEKNGGPHGRCCPAWGVFPKSHILNWPREAKPFWTLHPLQRGKGSDPGVVELSEVARLHGKVAGFLGDPLAALLFQPLFLSIPVGKGGAGAHLS